MNKIHAPTGVLRAHLKLAEKAAWAREFYRNAPDEGLETRQMWRHRSRRDKRAAGSRRLADNKPLLEDVRFFRAAAEEALREKAKAMGLVVLSRTSTGRAPKLVQQSAGKPNFRHPHQRRAADRVTRHA